MLTNSEWQTLLAIDYQLSESKKAANIILLYHEYIIIKYTLHSMNTSPTLIAV